MNHNGLQAYNYAESLTPYRRDLLLKIFFDPALVPSIEPQIIYVLNHMPEDRIDTALAWLVRNNLVGQKFIDWYFIDCEKSPLTMFAKLTSKVKRERLSVVMAGKDMKL